MFYNEYLLYCDKTDDLPLSAAILDLDRLKMINDSLGHSFGDRAITTVAKILKTYAKENYIFARIGGDEIAAFFPGTELCEAESFLKRAEEMIQPVRHPAFLLMGLRSKKQSGRRYIDGFIRRRRYDVPIEVQKQRREKIRDIRCNPQCTLY